MNPGINSGFSALIFVLVIDRALFYAPLFGCTSPLYATSLSFLITLAFAWLCNCAAKHRERIAVKILMPFFALVSVALAYFSISGFVKNTAAFGKPYSSQLFLSLAPIIVVLCAIYIVLSGKTTLFRTGLLVLPIAVAVTLPIFLAPFCNSMPLAMKLVDSTDFKADFYKAVFASLVMGSDLFAVYLCAPKQTLNAEKMKFKGVAALAVAYIVSLALTVCANRYFYGSPKPDTLPFVKILDTAFEIELGAFLLAFEVASLILRVAAYAGICKKTFDVFKKRNNATKRQLSQKPDVKI